MLVAEIPNYGASLEVLDIFGLFIPSQAFTFHGLTFHVLLWLTVLYLFQVSSVYTSTLVNLSTRLLTSVI